MLRAVAIVVAAFAGALTAPSIAHAQYAGARIVRCESREYRDNYCPADTRGGVRLARQISRQPCWEGESWGFDRRGIWVTQGCAAEFDIGAARGAPGDRYGYERNYGSPAYGAPPPGAPPPGAPTYGGPGPGRRVICESRDYRYRYCPVGVGRDVDLARQLSKTPCRFEYSWGFDRGGVWVDRGCAAEFAVY